MDHPDEICGVAMQLEAYQRAGSNPLRERGAMLGQQGGRAGVHRDVRARKLLR